MRSSRVAAESQLVAAAVKGDHAALADLCELHYDQILRFCRRLLRDRYAAEDLTQATFTRVVEKISSFDPQRPMIPWLQAIARNIYLDRMRARARRPSETELCEGAVPQGPPAREAVAETVVNRVVLGEALASLNPRYREVIRLRGIEGYSYKELASRLEATMPAVSKLVGRAAEQLRQRLDRVVLLGLLVRLRLRSGAGRAKANLEGLAHGVPGLYSAASVGVIGVVAGVVLSSIVSGPRDDVDRPQRRATSASSSVAAHTPKANARSVRPRPKKAVVRTGPVSVATREPLEDSADPTGGYLRVDLDDPRGGTLLWHESEHGCARGQVTPDGSPLRVRC